MAKRIYTGITDRNDFKVYTGDIVEMHYFCLGICGNGGVFEDEREVIGKVKVHWYNRKKRAAILCRRFKWKQISILPNARIK